LTRVRYCARVALEGRPPAERRAEMERANPKYILRNTMALEAYEAAARGDYSVAEEVRRLLCRPYDEQGSEADARWATPTPQWARTMPGLHTMS